MLAKESAEPTTTMLDPPARANGNKQPSIRESHAKRKVRAWAERGEYPRRRRRGGGARETAMRSRRRGARARARG